MIKNSILALTTAALVAGIAMPAFAASAAPDQNDNDKSYLTGEVANDYTLLRLKEKGINATSVEDWNGLVRAFVIKEDGTQAMQLFDADSLAPVGI
ncbi:hypothetical protein ASD83_15280 [Devosia sp. Root685]|uniref:hypothetical protein n=1 Tax=Devosia sp. Root685 TaxID=1736587 RepID=UPI0006F4CC6C|nr:hypothetical protein [Devosia sp. Root685]KRA96476.1 hypothetical protein ASD83_15280 [Devosia sp. Root685]